MRPRVSKNEQVKFIMECRRSGLSDYQWCEQNDILPGTFYNWVSKLRKSGYTFPDSNYKTAGTPIAQEVVKVNLIQHNDFPASIMEQNTSVLASMKPHDVAAEIVTANITVRLFNGANQDLIRNTLEYLGGVNHDR